MIVSLNLVVLRCANLDASRPFYEAVGFPFVEEQHGKGPVHFACERPSLVLELYPPNDAGATGNVMLGVTVADLEGTLTKLAALGFTPKSPPKNDRCTILDPDGSAVMVSEQRM